MTLIGIFLLGRDEERKQNLRERNFNLTLGESILPGEIYLVFWPKIRHVDVSVCNVPLSGPNIGVITSKRSRFKEQHVHFLKKPLEVL